MRYEIYGNPKDSNVIEEFTVTVEAEVKYYSSTLT